MNDIYERLSELERRVAILEDRQELPPWIREAPKTTAVVAIDEHPKTETMTDRGGDPRKE